MEPVLILWTGGWDSTFRVLDCALANNRKVQPFYVKDIARPSTEKELETIARITRLANARAGSELVAAPIVTDRMLLKPAPDITAAYNRLASLVTLGTQYEWLAQFVRESNHEGVELGVLGETIAKFLRGEIGEQEDVRTVFGGFAFPLLYKTKRQMRDEAESRGFLDLLEMSWFCHRGRKEPCGTCSPCADAIRDGMGYRLPTRAKAKYRLRHILFPNRTARSLRRRIVKLLRGGPRVS